MKASDRYLKIVQWSEEDGCYIGTCPGLMLGGVHGDNEMEVYAELCEAAEECIQIYQEDGETLPEPTAKGYAGQFNLNVGEELHKVLSVAALQAGESLNNFCANILKQHISVHNAL
ncbi:MAG: toxin-antitoxin system HicB family antitoxin [Candidatus Parabeggiatoa sp. nov. 1]|nr:MAG: toxin-antitoxin system HicB family antitoxin [Gammaproteobacteria bacterium]